MSANVTTLTVYSKPDCVQCSAVQCNATYRALDAAKVEYEVIDIGTDSSARDYAMSLGHRTAPVVVQTSPNSGDCCRLA